MADDRQNVPVGTVMNLDTESPVTVLRDWDTLVIPSCRLDAEGLALLRAIINRETVSLAAVHEEIAEDDAGCRAEENG